MIGWGNGAQAENCLKECLTGCTMARKALSPRPMQNTDAEQILSALLSDAKASGAEAADAVLYSAVASGVSWRMGNLEDVERSESADLRAAPFWSVNARPAFPPPTTRGPP